MEGEKFENPYFDRLVGVPTRYADQQEYLNQRLAEYTEQKGRHSLEGLEIEATPHDQEIINFAQQSAAAMLKKYGREKDVLVSPDHIHILKKGGTEEWTEGRLTGGAHSTAYASILVDREPRDVDFCLIAFHELLHLGSYRAYQLIHSKNGDFPNEHSWYRSGFAVLSRDGKERFFENIEEAVIETLTEEFLETELKNHPLFAEEIKAMEKRGDSIQLSRIEERKNLNELIDILWEVNGADYPNRSDILSLFIDAQINGRLLAVGKLIEKTFGKGSLREVAKGNKPSSADEALVKGQDGAILSSANNTDADDTAELEEESPSESSPSTSSG